jgi:carbon-monoxide dehydrogenase medium subunit
MKAAAFDYAQAATIDEAVELLAQHGASAKLLAGGQSLLPALNLRLMSPDILIDIGKLASLRGIHINGDTISIGALTRHTDLLVSPAITAHAPLIAQAMPHIAHPAIRNRGTIGGSLANADPASELPACVLALGATLVARSVRGERRIAAAAFFRGLYETALEPDELLTDIEFPVTQPGDRAFFQEFARRVGDYAIVGLAAQATLSDGYFSKLSLAFFGVGDRATRCPEAASILLRQPIAPRGCHPAPHLLPLS